MVPRWVVARWDIYHFKSEQRDDKEGDDCPFFYFLQTELFGRR